MIDSLGLADHYERLGSRLADTAALAAGAELDVSPERLVLVPGPYSRLVADAISSWACGSTGPAVAVADAGSDLSGCGDAVVVAVGLSGDDAVAMQSVRQAGDAGATTVIVGDEPIVRPGDDAVALPLPASVPTRRHNVPDLLMATAVLAGRLGSIEAPEVETVVDRVSDRMHDAESAEHVESVARRIGSTVPLFHGAGWVGVAAAKYAKTLVNGDMKTLAFAATHDQVAAAEGAAWGLHGDVTRQVFTAVFMRHAYETETAAARWTDYEDELVEFTSDVVRLDATGSGRFVQLMDLMAQAQALTMAMADRAGVDPGPAPGLA